MNYINPTRNAFIVPQGTELKRTKESNEFKSKKDFLANCLNKKLSTNGRKVYNIKAVKQEKK